MADIKENPKEAVELSQEELTAKRDEITKYYKDHIPHLEAQLEYEGLLRDIEKCRAERMQAQQFMTKMSNVPPTPPVPEVKKPVVNPANRQALEDFEKAKDATKSNEEGKKRTLKKASKDA